MLKRFFVSNFSLQSHWHDAAKIYIFILVAIFVLTDTDFHFSIEIDKKTISENSFSALLFQTNEINFTKQNRVQRIHR